MNTEETAARTHVGFTELPDLLAEAVGGKALWANDEFFAPKENLLKPGRGIFIPDKFTEFGKWMDGWETRRRRTPGHDTCILKLGMPGLLRGVDIDTHHFVGNYPEYASVEGCEAPLDTSLEALQQANWVELVPRARLQGSARNLFPVTQERRVTHLRLHIFPDGGVARFRAHGVVLPDWQRLLLARQPLDLAALENGGTVIQCNDAFFGPKDNLILPGRAKTMGEGWETRRKRRPGFDWIVVKLGRLGNIQRLEVDTHHFKGNFPESCSLEGVRLEEEVQDFHNAQHLPWKELLPRTPLRADTAHRFEAELEKHGPFTHVRLNIFPDGGVSRLRVWGTPA